jgi:hypothetical protein
MHSANKSFTQPFLSLSQKSYLLLLLLDEKNKKSDLFYDTTAGYLIAIPPEIASEPGIFSFYQDCQQKRLAIQCHAHYPALCYYMQPE